VADDTADGDAPVRSEVPAALFLFAIAFCCVGLAPWMVGFAVVPAVAEIMEAVAGGLEEGDDDDAESAT